MVEAERDISKYSTHPVRVEGRAQDLANFVQRLQQLDCKAERRARLWLGPLGWLKSPFEAWARLREPWCFLAGLVTMPIWIFPLMLATTILLPFTLVWLILYRASNYR